MSSDAHAIEAHGEHGASVGTNIAIWIALVAITFLEVFLAYKQLEPTLMLTILVILSVVKAALIMSFLSRLRPLLSFRSCLVLRGSRVLRLFLRLGLTARAYAHTVTPRTPARENAGLPPMQRAAPFVWH